MKTRVKKPKRSVVEGDEYFYRHPEMMRVEIESDIVKKEEKKEKDETEK